MISEKVLWTIHLPHGSMAMLADDVLEEYLQVEDMLFRLEWQQNNVREAQYKRCNPVQPRPIIITDTVPETT